MKYGQRHYSFSTAAFSRTKAHDGENCIDTFRAEEQPSSAFNFIDLTRVPPGATIGEHTHGSDNEEVYIIIQGAGLAQIDGEEVQVSPGHVIVNRPGGTHGLRNTGNEDLCLVVIEADT